MRLNRHDYGWARRHSTCPFTQSCRCRCTPWSAGYCRACAFTRVCEGLDSRKVYCQKAHDVKYPNATLVYVPKATVAAGDLWFFFTVYWDVTLSYSPRRIWLPTRLLPILYTLGRCRSTPRRFRGCRPVANHQAVFLSSFVRSVCVSERYDDSIVCPE